ncbi:MAG: N-acetyl-D-glucosamine ABC transporter, permease protein 2, partial [uncultured Rubrobacteraceae bacterium]
GSDDGQCADEKEPKGPAPSRQAPPAVRGSNPVDGGVHRPPLVDVLDLAQAELPDHAVPSELDPAGLLRRGLLDDTHHVHPDARTPVVYQQPGR